VVAGGPFSFVSRWAITTTRIIPHNISCGNIMNNIHIYIVVDEILNIYGWVVIFLCVVMFQCVPLSNNILYDIESDRVFFSENRSKIEELSLE